MKENIHVSLFLFIMVMLMSAWKLRWRTSYFETEVTKFLNAICIHTHKKRCKNSKWLCEGLEGLIVGLETYSWLDFFSFFLLLKI